MSQTIVTSPLSHTVRRALLRLREDPDLRSVLIGVLGTILVHLLLLLVGPRLLRSEAPNVLMRPHASARQFSIEIAPDTFKQPPKPKPPMKFVETNPDAPENVPDNTNNVAARNQQVAQEKPTPNGKSDRPAIEGQKEIHSTQIVTGQLIKPTVPTPVPPSTEVKAVEGKLLASRLEQSPLPGIDKQIGENTTAFGSNIAKFAANPQNVPEKVEGLKFVPLIDGANDRPAASPAPAADSEDHANQPGHL